jgi:hypothetical protein
MKKIINFAKAKNAGKEKINNLKDYIEENFLNQNTDLKNPIELIKNLPFFRLIKKNIFK